MKLTKKELMSPFVLIIVLIGIILLVIPFGNFRRNDFLVLTTFVLNGFIWTILLIKEMQKRAFSLAFMHWSFCLFFFFFAAILQYAYNIFPWVYFRNDDVLLYSNIILLIWTVSVVLGKGINIVGLKYNKTYNFNKMSFSRITIPSLMVLLVIFFWKIANIGFVNLLSRSTNTYAISESSAIAVLIEHSLSAISYFSALFCILAYKNKEKSVLYAIIASLLLLLAFPPTGLARYEAAVIYFGILLTCSSYLKKTRFFSGIFLLAFIVILPALNAFRHTAFDNVSFSLVVGKIIGNISTSWLGWDYDAYTMLTLTVDYIENNGITWGMQFLGALLFWVPRQYWPSKPNGSGYEIAEGLGLNFANLSCPLPAEGLINFSIFGVIIFAIFIGSLMRLLDNLYWSNPFGINTITMLYPIIVLFFFFMSRGDLMSSFAYLIAYIVIGLIYIRIIKTISKIHIK